MSTCRVLRSLPLLLLTACVEGGGADHPHTDGTDGDAPSTEGITTAATETTGAPQDPTCIDDYHGNQDHQSALALELETTDTASITLGDGVVSKRSERGGDELVVCDAEPSDFFELEAQCAGYLIVEARRLDGSMPEMLLYDDGGLPIERVMGDWSAFFLKPLQRKIGAGIHVIEVRHSRGRAERYSLTVVVLPDSPCWR